MVYQFIKDNHKEFGLRWLLRKFKLSPNAYYNFLKNRKSTYYVRRQKIYDKIKEIYYATEGNLGHRNMVIFLERRGISCNKITVHKYMNKELKLTSIVKRRKPGYKKDMPIKFFPTFLSRISV